jgi:hypothetical protein
MDEDSLTTDQDDCVGLSAASIRRERMIRDDSTQPESDQPYSEPYWEDE